MICLGHLPAMGAWARPRSVPWISTPRARSSARPRRMAPRRSSTSARGRCWRTATATATEGAGVMHMVKQMETDGNSMFSYPKVRWFYGFYPETSWNIWDNARWNHHHSWANRKWKRFSMAVGRCIVPDIVIPCQEVDHNSTIWWADFSQEKLLLLAWEWCLCAALRRDETQMTQVPMDYFRLL